MAVRAHTQSRHARGSGSKIDALESRRMLVTFSGTNGADIIEINALGTLSTVTINGTTQSTSATNIVVNGLDGGDIISVRGTRSNSIITVNGGNGDDYFQNLGQDMDAVYNEQFTFLGGPGDDFIAADNRSDDADFKFFVIDHDSIIRDGSTTFGIPDRVLLRYGEVEELEFNDNNNGNVMEFTDLHGSGYDMRVTLLGNGGDDAFHNNIGFSPILGNSIGSLGIHINGGSGGDSFSAVDTGGLAPSTYQLNLNSIVVDSAAAHPGPITLVSCEKAQVLGAAHGNTFTLSTMPSGVFYSVSTGDGDDTVTLGNGDLDSNGYVVGNLGIGGGAGTDVLQIDDQLDREGEVETYTFGGQSLSGSFLTKGTAGFKYGSFETCVLNAANGVSSLNVPNTVNFESHDTFDDPDLAQTILNGGSLRQCLVTIGKGFLSSLVGDFDIRLGAAKGTVSVNDASNTQPALYRIGSNSLLAPKNIVYSGATLFQLAGTQGSGTYSVDAVAAGVPVSINAGAGADFASLGDGNISANLLSPITFQGGGGSDTVTLDNSLDPTLATQSLTGNIFTDVQPFLFLQTELLATRGGPGGTNLTVNSAPFRLDLTGGTGNDVMTIGGGDLDSNFPAAAPNVILASGNGGDDEIRFNDVNDNSAGTYTFSKTPSVDQLIKHNGSTDHIFQWFNIDRVTLDASNAPSAPQDPTLITVTDISSPLRINGNAGSDKISIADAAGIVTVHTGSGDVDQLIVNSDFTPGDAPVTVVVEQSDDVDVLDIRPGGLLRVATGATLVKTRQSPTTSTFNLQGVLDLAGGSLLSRSGGPTTATFRALLSAGFNGGAWNGTSATGAINSSLAASTTIGDGIGYGPGSEIAPTSIGGFSIAAGDVLLQHTLNGDVDLDRAVGFNDLLRVAQNYDLTGRSWTQGDFDYDGSSGFNDLLSVAQNYGSTMLSDHRTAPRTRDNLPFNITDADVDVV